MSQKKLEEFISLTAKKFAIPGVAAAVFANGQSVYACQGVTSIENPLPIEQNTLFLAGSITKTFTATLVMRLAAEGKLDLHTPVCKYIPELSLSDEKATKEITVSHLLNHTSGLGWDLLVDIGEGDDALSVFVNMKLRDLEILSEPAIRASYSQAGYSLLGRVIENVTGLTFENAIASLVLQPLSLANSFFALEDVITRRFAVGHNLDEHGELSIARLWRGPRYRNPGGGLSISVEDMLSWARFHLNNGDTKNEISIIPEVILQQMKQETVKLRGTSLGDAIGIGWFLRNIDGLHTAGHLGSANGQFAETLLIPERSFAIVSFANAGPNGIQFNQEVVRWALQQYLGIIDKDPEPLPHDHTMAEDLTGTFVNDAMTLSLTSDGIKLIMDVRLKPEVRASMGAECPPDFSPATIGLLPDKIDEYIVTEGGLKGQRGFFTRNESGFVTGVDIAGRIFNRVEK